MTRVKGGLEDHLLVWREKSDFRERLTEEEEEGAEGKEEMLWTEEEVCEVRRRRRGWGGRRC